MKRKSKEELFRKTICELIRSNYYADDLKALKLIYERLVIFRYILDDLWPCWIIRLATHKQ